MAIHPKQKIWKYIVDGLSKDQIIEKGIESKIIQEFYNDWQWKIDELTLVRKEAKKIVVRQIEKINDQFEIDNSNQDKKLFKCPFCKQKINKERLEIHINLNHPISPRPSMNAKKKTFKAWYYEYEKKEAFKRYIKSRILYTPM